MHIGELIKIDPTIGNAFEAFCVKEGIDPSNADFRIMQPHDDGIDGWVVPVLMFADKNDPWGEGNRTACIGRKESTDPQAFEHLAAHAS